MKLKFWYWLHDRLEFWWHWVYYKKIAPNQQSEIFKIMPENSTFSEWLTYSCSGFAVRTVGLASVILFLIGSVVSWVGGGNAWIDDIMFDHHRTLIQCIWLNLQWIWHLAHHIF